MKKMRVVLLGILFFGLIGALVFADALPVEITAQRGSTVVVTKNGQNLANSSNFPIRVNLDPEEDYTIRLELPKADLRVTDFIVTQSPTANNQSVSFSGKVENIGEGTAVPSQVKVELEPYGGLQRQERTFDIPQLGPRANQSFGGTFENCNFPERAQYRLFADADSGFVVNEGRFENDNRAIARFTGVPPQQQEQQQERPGGEAQQPARLTIPTLVIRAPQPTTRSTNLNYRVVVANSGGSAAENLRVRVTVSDQGEGNTINITCLEPGQTSGNNDGTLANLTFTRRPYHLIAEVFGSNGERITSKSTLFRISE